jgi:hypothetical protein
VPRGLARVEPEDNTLVAYAARAGTTADDEQILVPIDVQFTLPSSPTMVGLSIEGTGCCDQFRVQGEFEHSVVPEPPSVLLISLGVAGLLAHQVRRRTLRFNRSIA